ncbi:RNA polymerase sigma factor [Ostreiculturibacter nitratireducens]|uniref:RNA polymerase sigma factor n=1 Tax=Ostreiculturibacter nitratireducens TaxID=3075226 RepID=UPI0031B64668
MASPTQLEALLPELRAYARSLDSHSDTAEDLVQDAIERTLRAPNVPVALSELRPWMFRVIRNLHYDELRKWRVRREYIASEKRRYSVMGTVADHARDVLLRLAYERLPPEKREILFLVDIMGLRYSEAADIIGIARGTVMSRLSRARHALRMEVDRDRAVGTKRRSGNASE